MLKVIEAGKTDKKDIKRFYKQQHYNASFIGQDRTFLIKDNHLIVAAVIVSLISTDNHQALLHGLLVNKTYRKQNLATTLLNFTSKQYDALICFAEPAQEKFYIKRGFSIEHQQHLSPCLLSRYLAYKKKKTDLLIFAKINQKKLIDLI